MGARFFDPYLARWLSADTIVPDPGEPQDFNRFSYVRNNPLVYVDPNGHECKIVGGDEYCGDDIPDQGELPPLPPDMWWAWDILSEEEQYLVYLEYLIYLEDPSYYQELWQNDSFTSGLTYLRIWAEYAEGEDLELFLNVDKFDHWVSRMAKVDERYASGEISQDEWWATKGPALFALGGMNFDFGEAGNEAYGAAESVLQTGGNTLRKATLKALNLTKEQGGRALEALKDWKRLPSNYHGKVWDNGDYTDMDGNRIGNIYDFLD
jgi:hypothetical protein